MWIFRCAAYSTMHSGQMIAPRLAGESSDTESADHTTSEIRQKKSFISVFKKNSEKVTTIPEESSKVQLEEPPSEQPKGGNETKPQGNVDNEGVVYAELDIQARHSDRPPIVRGDDDKTEYAEIIHTKSQPK